MLWTGRRNRALIFAVLLANAGCSTAAEVFLDIPKSTSETSDADSDAQLKTAGAAAIAEPERVPPPIESVQDPDSMLAMLPRHPSGLLDWSEAVRDGTISPQNSLPGGSRGDQPMDFGYDFYFGDVETYFPHSSHVDWLTCGNCHPSIFRQRGTEMSMQMISEGESCGVCHGPVAFAADVCDRCHPAFPMEDDRYEPSFGAPAVISRDTTAVESSLPPSLFPHSLHRIRYSCEACHPDPFVMQAGGTAYSMQEMQSGKSCGICHDGGTAFGILECGRCHREPPGESTPE